jgi:hypothetical protein
MRFQEELFLSLSPIKELEAFKLLILTTILSLWRLNITLHKLFILLLFLLFIDIQAQDTADGDFDVLVLYPSAVAITISTNEISLVLTEEQAIHHIEYPTDLLVGTFTVTVTSSGATEFTVITSSPPQYVNATNHFHCICDHDDTTKCTLAVYSDKTQTGTSTETELLDNSILIYNNGCDLQKVFEREIDVFLYRIIYAEDDEACICHLPLYFTLTSP